MRAVSSGTQVPRRVRSRSSFKVQMRAVSSGTQVPRRVQSRARFARFWGQKHRFGGQNTGFGALFSGDFRLPGTSKIPIFGVKITVFGVEKPVFGTDLDPGTPLPENLRNPQNPVLRSQTPILGLQISFSCSQLGH